MPAVLCAAAFLLLAGILYLTVWPVSADKAYVLSVNTPVLTLPIENGTAAEADIYYDLIPLSPLYKARAKKSFQECQWSGDS